MLHDFADTTRPRMRFEGEIVNCELLPDRVELVRFTRIRLHEVLKHARRIDRNVAVTNCTICVLHDQKVKIAANSERMLCVVKLGTPRNNGSAPKRKSAR